MGYVIRFVGLLGLPVVAGVRFAPSSGSYKSETSASVYLPGSSISSKGAEEMDETLHRLTRLSVPALRRSWSWQRL